MFESAFCSDRDTTEEANRVQARFELDRCATPADFASWARRWGRSLCDSAEADELKGEIASALDDLAAKEADIVKLEDRLENVRLYVVAQCRQFDNMPDVLDAYLEKSTAMLVSLADELEFSL